MLPIYDAVDKHGVSTVVIVCGSQMGKTEFQLCVLGHRFHDGPYMPALYVGPTEKLVRSMSSDRVDKMLRSTPDLWDRLEKGHRNKVVEKWIGGVRLGFAWAGSATELASHPAGLILIDERDRMDSDAGGEGDPVELCRARTETFPNSKIVIASTPTIEGASPIWSLWEEGSKGKWAWPCPECDEFFVPYLEYLWWPEGSDPANAEENARLNCPHCGSQLKDHQKKGMNAKGRYQFYSMSEEGEHELLDEEPVNSVASFWVSGLCSPWRPWGGLARRMVAAYQSAEIERIQAVVNTGGGELFRTKGEAPDWNEVLGLRLTYKKGECPDRVQMVTCGVDVQKGGVYFIIRGWGYASESWLIDHGFIPFRTDLENAWSPLGALFDMEWVNQRGQAHKISRMVVDSGYMAPQVYTFCRRYPEAYASKGYSTLPEPWTISLLDRNIAGIRLKGGQKLIKIDTDYMKTWLHARIQWSADEPGGFHLHQQVDEEYCHQIVSEEVITKVSGKRAWVRKYRHNHFFDCEVYGLTAALMLGVQRLQPIAQADAKGKVATQAKVEAPSSHQSSSFMRGRRSLY